MMPALSSRNRTNDDDLRRRRLGLRGLRPAPQAAASPGRRLVRPPAVPAQPPVQALRAPDPEPAAGVPLGGRKRRGAPSVRPGSRSSSRTPGGAGPSVRGRRAPRRSAAKQRLATIAALVVPVLAMLAIYVVPSAGAEDSQVAMPDDPTALSGLVKARNGGFLVDGRPWQAVGFNDYRLVAEPGGYVCDGDSGEVSGAELGDELDRARAAGATVIRTWFFQSSWDADGDGDGDWSAFDRIVDAAAARGIRVVPVLANHWTDCENGGAEKDLDFYAGGYAEAQGPYALNYLEYAAAIAQHYAGSPAIAYWQLINEPEASADGSCDESAAADALAGFAQAGADAIHSVDPTHLISLGTIGGGQCGTSGSDYMRANEAVDVCEIHVYDGAATGTSPTEAVPENAAAAISSCSGAGKPVVAGELGYAADLDESGNETGTVTETTLANRAGFLAARVDAMGQAGLDGFQVWQLDDSVPISDDTDPYAVGPCDPIEDVVRSAAGNFTQPVAADGGCGPSAGQGSPA